MSKMNLKSTGFVVIIILLLSGVTLGQTVYKIDGSSKMSILGTSTIHDWESAVTNLSGNASITVEGMNIKSIDNFSFSLPVDGIESGNSIMDGKTYKALLQKTHPKIQYKLTSVSGVSGRQLNSKGTLTVAGVSKQMDIPVEYTVNGNTINCKGSVNFKMTDFKIDPPTALLGTLLTGDDITVKFDIVFKK